MDFALLEPSLCAWVRDLSGVKFAVFENAPRPMHDGRLAVLSWVQWNGTGTYETRYEDTGAPSGNELVAVTITHQNVTLQVSIEAFDNRPGSPNARTLMERFRGRLWMPASLDLLRNVNLGLINNDAAVVSDYRVDGRWISRCVMSVRFNASTFEREDAPLRGSIASTDVTSTITDVDGTPVPDVLQMDHEDIPPS